MNMYKLNFIYDGNSRISSDGNMVLEVVRYNKSVLFIDSNDGVSALKSMKC